MEELSAHGMTLRWPGGQDVDPARILIEAGPVAAGNVVNVLYALDGGPERLCRAWPVGMDPQSGLQTFAARLPETPPGTRLDWRPLLSNGLRELAPPPAAPAEPQHPAAAPRATTGIPPAFDHKIERLARVTVPLSQTPTKIGDTPEGLMIVFPLGEGGTVRGPRLNGTVEHIGGDWMRVRPDGIGICAVRAVVDCDDGAKLLADYGGVADFGRDGYAALSAGGGPKVVDIQLTPRFISASPDYAWLNRTQCLGLGRVTMTEMLVEYDLYAVHSLACRDTGGQHG